MEINTANNDYTINNGTEIMAKILIYYSWQFLFGSAILTYLIYWNVKRRDQNTKGVYYII